MVRDTARSFAAFVSPVNALAARSRRKDLARQSKGNQLASPNFSTQPISNIPPCSTIASPAQTPSSANELAATIANVRYDYRAAPFGFQTVVVFTPDALRLHDHPALTAALSAGHRYVVPVLVAHQGAYDVHGGHCAWYAAASDLRRSLQAKGSDLIVLDGSAFSASNEASHASVTRTVLDACRLLRASVVYSHASPTERQPLIQGMCEDAGIEYVTLWNGTLLRPGQLPFEICDLPVDCDSFADATELIGADVPAPVPESLPTLPPDAAHLVSELPLCPVASAHTLQSMTRAPSVFPLSETDALRMAADFFRPTNGIVSTVRMGRTGEESTVSRPCACACQTSPVRYIDTILGQLAKSLTVGILSSRLLHQVMRDCDLAEGSPRRYCAKLELLQHDHRAFLAMKLGDADVSAKSDSVKPLSNRL
jgi:hypothetical protein